MWKAFASNFIIHFVVLITQIGHDSWFLTVATRPPPPHPNWPTYLLPSKTAGGGGKENTPFFKPYWHAAAPKGMVFAPFRFENGYKVYPFWSGIGYGFRGNCGTVWTYLSFQLQMNKKERVICKLQKDLKKSFCWRFNLSNDDICKHVCCVFWPPPGLKTGLDWLWNRVMIWRTERHTLTKNS